jgi:DNA-binding CsgD family transcriptional regulator
VVNLTEREHKVVALVADGLHDEEIAQRLGITTGAIKQHLHNIYQKLGIKSRLQLALAWTKQVRAEADKAASEVAVKQHLIRERDQMLAEIEALRNKIAGIEIALMLFSDAPTEAVPVAPTKPSANGDRIGVTETIVNLIRESGEAGLKPMDVVEQAAQRGVGLKRGSVYVLLNRIERAGTVVREDGRYKLREFTAHSEPAAGSRE